MFRREKLKKNIMKACVLDTHMSILNYNEEEIQKKEQNQYLIMGHIYFPIKSYHISLFNVMIIYIREPLTHSSWRIQGVTVLSNSSNHLETFRTHNIKRDFDPTEELKSILISFSLCFSNTNISCAFFCILAIITVTLFDTYKHMQIHKIFHIISLGNRIKGRTCC